MPIEVPFVRGRAAGAVFSRELHTARSLERAGLDSPPEIFCRGLILKDFGQSVCLPREALCNGREFPAHFINLIDIATDRHNTLRYLADTCRGLLNITGDFLSGSTLLLDGRRYGCRYVAENRDLLGNLVDCPDSVPGGFLNIIDLLFDFISRGRRLSGQPFDL